MRFHTLQSVWASTALSRQLSEGVIPSGAEQPPGGLAESFCDDSVMDGRLRYLHSMARVEGRCVQSHIDSYLAAVGYLVRFPGEAAFARMMVMSPSDSPQEGTLPDLGFLLRVVMMQAFVEVKRSSKAQKEPQREGRPVASEGLLSESGSGSISASIVDSGEGHDEPSCDTTQAARATSNGSKKTSPRSAAPVVHWSHTPSLGIQEDDFSVQMTLRVFPCLRRSSQRMCCVRSGEQVGLCVLLGLLLGLYPHAAKFPPFAVRVLAYCSVHRLITGGLGAAFCSSFPMLFTLAYMEYYAHVVTAYLPAEMEVLSREVGVSSFFSSCPLVCDAFRQEMLNDFSGGFDWAALESYCAGVVDKHMRACKNRFKGRKEALAGVRVDAAALRAFRELALVVPYDLHRDDAAHSIMGSELAFLMDRGDGVGLGTGLGLAGCKPNEACVSVAVMQRLIRVDPLPRNMTQMQLRTLYARMRRCERSAIDAMYLYICVSCSFVKGGQRVHQIRGQCKLHVGGASDALMCSSCQTLSVVAVNALGRVVSIRQQRYYLAPCCLSVQLYRSTGVEFQTEFCDPSFFGEEIMARIAWRPDIHPSMCQHAPGGVRPQGKPQRAQCDVCVGRQSHSDSISGSAMQLGDSLQEGAGTACLRFSSSLECFSFVDHLTGEMRTARLCQRHTPHSGVLRHVVNWSEFVQEVLQRGRG